MTRPGDRLTEWIMLAGVAIWIAWEVVILYRRHQGLRLKTLSMVLQHRAWEWNLLPWFTGVLVGHWWLNRCGEIGGLPWIYVALGALTLGVMCFDIYSRAHLTLNRKLRYPGLWLVLGTVAGALLFPQRHIGGCS